MFVVKEIAEGITDFTVPDVDTKQIKAQAGKLVDILIDGHFKVHTHLFSSPESMGEGGRIVDTKASDFSSIRIPAHDAISANIDLITKFLSHGVLRYEM